MFDAKVNKGDYKGETEGGRQRLAVLRADQKMSAKSKMDAACTGWTRHDHVFLYDNYSSSCIASMGR